MYGQVLFARVEWLPLFVISIGTAASTSNSYSRGLLNRLSIARREASSM